MSSDTVETFAESARSVNATVTETEAAEVETRLTSLIDPPAVGVDPGIDGVSLPEPVTLDPTTQEVVEAKTGVTGAALGIADYGSVVIRGTPAGEEATSLFVNRHVAVVARSDIVPDMPTAFDSFGDWLRGGSDAVIATGPSATADMGALVWGAHGPKALDIVVVADR